MNITSLLQHCFDRFLRHLLDLGEIDGGAVVGLQLVVAALGLRHEGDGLVQQLGGGPLVEAQAGAESGHVFAVKEAGAAHGLHTGDVHRMPGVIR